MTASNTVLTYSEQGEQDAKATLIALHGRGASGQDMALLTGGLQLEGVRIILPNAPVPFYGAYAWYPLPPDREKDVYASAQRLQDFLAALESEGVDLARTALLGFSQGAVMTLEVGLTTPKPLAGLLALSGYLFDPGSLIARIQPAAQKTPIFLAHGTEDTVIPVERGRDAFEKLRAAGMDVSFHEYPIEHRVSSAEMKEIRMFLVTHLGLEPRDSRSL